MAKNTQRTMPVLPLRDVVVFPYMVMPLFVGQKEFKEKIITKSEL